MVEAMFGVVLLMIAGFFFWVFHVLIRTGRPLGAVIIAFTVLFFVASGSGLIFDSCKTSMREQQAKIAREHKGHEALHARIEAELMTAESGDILMMSNGERMFIMFKRGSEITARHIYASAEGDHFYVDQLVLDHVRVLKLGTPEYATALVAETEKVFSSLRRRLEPIR